MKNKVIYALLSAVIAFGLWMYVITVVNPEAEQTYYDVPVVLTNESVLKDKGLMILTDTDPKVTLVLRGNRTDLNRLKNSDITLLADLAKINTAGNQYLNYSISYPGEFADNAFEVLSHAPDQVNLEIVEWGSKEVDVVVDFPGNTPPDYFADKENVILNHEKVTITGPKSVIDQIAQARVNVSLDGRTQTFRESFRYTLCDEAGNPVDAAQIKTNVAEVEIELRVLRVKEVPLLVDVVFGGGANAGNAQVVVNPQTIKVAGIDTILADLDKIVLGTVNLADIAENTTLTFPIHLAQDLINLSGLEEATVEVTFDGLETKTLTISNIQVTGLPQNMTASVGTQVCKITVRGPKAQIDAITEEHVTIRVDLANAQPGENIIVAQVYVDGAFPGVGALHTYKISVLVSQP